MKGDLVIARAYGGEPVILRVWSESDTGVWLTDETEYQLLISGKGGCEPVLGFPREDVFEYDSELAIIMEESYGKGKCDWNQLTPY